MVSAALQLLRDLKEFQPTAEAVNWRPTLEYADVDLLIAEIERLQEIAWLTAADKNDALFQLAYLADGQGRSSAEWAVLEGWNAVDHRIIFGDFAGDYTDAAGLFPLREGEESGTVTLSRLRDEWDGNPDEVDNGVSS